MLPSLRLVIYFALGALLWVAAAVRTEFLVVAALYDIVLVFLAALDLVLSPQPRDFEVARQVPGKMNLGVANKVVVQARSRANAPVTLTVRDEPPVTWPVTIPQTADHERRLVGQRLPSVARVTLQVMPVREAPVQEARAEYMVTPTRRGQWQFGALSARYPTRLGLWHRQFRRPAQETVRVYPDTNEVRRYELLLREGRLRDIGLHVARLRGRGTEFESLREYTTDDNYKDINWKASARRAKLISTNYEIERDQTVLIAVDCGRMMTALAVSRESHTYSPEPNVMSPKSSSDGHQTEGTGLLTRDTRHGTGVALSKLDCAINATVLLAHVSASMGDAVGVLLFADSVLGFVPPRKGRQQTGAIIEALYAVQPALVEPDYAGAYHYLMTRRVRRALVVTFTDLIDPFASRELLTASTSLRRHHNALCVTINNRDVMDLAGAMPNSADELYTKAMALRMLAQRRSALEELRRNGVGILDVEASQLTVATVNRYLDLKSRAAL
jgi:uncharacterized protein (DUF58 family)